jgi:chemotaxis protein methyltransferase CheR
VSDYTQIVRKLSEKTGIDFENYADSSMARRIERFQAMHKIQSDEAFLKYIDNARTEEINEVVNELSVNTTEFYRDPDTWNFIKTEIIPAIAHYNSIRVWHAGCSTGEELVSSAILFSEAGLQQKVKITACDINKKVLQLAAIGKYSLKCVEQSMENIREVMPLATLEQYFFRTGTDWTVNFAKLPEINFRSLDLTTIKPFTKFDIIFCRNVMIYFNPVLQEKIVKLFTESLFKGGVIVVGSKESLMLCPSYNLVRKLKDPYKIYQLKS